MNFPVKSKGFTLIEMLIVTAIMSSLLLLAGALGVESVDKARAQVELISTYNLIKQSGARAFTSGKPVTLDFSGSELNVFVGQNIWKKKSYKYVDFEAQTMRFSENGMLYDGNLTLSLRGVEKTLDLSALADRSNGL